MSAPKRLYSTSGYQFAIDSGPAGGNMKEYTLNKKTIEAVLILLFKLDEFEACEAMLEI